MGKRENHFDNNTFERSNGNPNNTANPQPPPHYAGTKMKALEKEGFKSPTITVKQPRKEKFFLPISNPFEALNTEADATQDLQSAREKRRENTSCNDEDDSKL
ncbi:hypothetical protein NPIL_29601 [Nephila pilipes]|uniref:Uncharacterized protein n=1 Tax=Nephila pilipes TaxID=299642 RepID=A0A8X6QL60_NEPPI|nr:hypothetical protein NPIL_29601 [Nephila pilipes]